MNKWMSEWWEAHWPGVWIGQEQRSEPVRKGRMSNQLWLRPREKHNGAETHMGEGGEGQCNCPKCSWYGLGLVITGLGSGGVWPEVGRHCCQTVHSSSQMSVHFVYKSYLINICAFWSLSVWMSTYPLEGIVEPHPLDWKGVPLI